MTTRKGRFSVADSAARIVLWYSWHSRRDADGEDVVLFDDDLAAELLQLRGTGWHVDEVSSDGAQAYKIVVYIDEANGVGDYAEDAMHTVSDFMNRRAAFDRGTARLISV